MAFDRIAMPSPGQIARVRQRLYLFEETVPLVNEGDATLVRLSCVNEWLIESDEESFVDFDAPMERA